MRKAAILVADDHRLFAEGMVATLQGRYSHVEMVLSIRELEVRLKQRKFDLVTLDLSFHEVSALDSLPGLVKAYPATRFLVVSASARRVLAAAARKAGATGYVIKESSAEELCRAIDDALEGKEYISPPLLPGTLPPPGMRKSGGLPRWGDPLTGRELDVLKWLHAGLSQGEVAERLSIRRTTVEYHLQEISKRLGIVGAPMMVRWYEEQLSTKPR